MKYFEAKGKNPCTVLLIEDEKNLAEITANYLIQENISVVCTGNGAEGLALVGKWHFDAIIVDLVVAGMGGISVCQEVRNLGHKVPLVLTTGHSALLHSVNLKRLGINRAFAKPFKLSELAAALRELIELYRVELRKAMPAGFSDRSWRQKRDASCQEQARKEGQKQTSGRMTPEK